MESTWPVVEVKRRDRLDWVASSREGDRTHLGFGMTRAGALRDIKRDRAKWLRRQKPEYVRVEE